jgi:hypothetical protein
LKPQFYFFFVLVFGDALCELFSRADDGDALGAAVGCLSLCVVDAGDVEASGTAGKVGVTTGVADDLPRSRARSRSSASTNAASADTALSSAC